MGLDMFLYKADEFGNFDWGTDEVGYWRKANQVHKWFVDNVQNGVDDCREYVVTLSNVKELLETCKKVLSGVELKKGKVINGYKYENDEMIPCYEDGEYIEDATIAEKLLPISSGFFFGGTEYDQWYVWDLKHTVEILEKVLEDFDFENSQLIYVSSW